MVGVALWHQHHYYYFFILSISYPVGFWKIDRNGRSGIIIIIIIIIIIPYLFV